MARDIAKQQAHLQEIIRRLNVQRSDDNREVTKEYGYMKFDEDEFNPTTRLSQYIRLALQTPPVAVVEFMQYGWQLPTPDLIISVTGGGKQCHISTHLRKIFQCGLVVAAATTNAWLITSGTNVGVVKIVGEALNNYRYKSHKHGLDVPCIGICSWEYTAGSEQLENPTRRTSSNDDDGLAPPPVRIRRRSILGSTALNLEYDHHVRNYVARQSDTKRCALESNHTHFLLFDGKTSNNDIVLLQRAQIEKYSRHVDIKSPSDEALIPTVMILLEGGPFSIRTICNALQSNTPLVVVKGSGRAADLVSDLHAYYSHLESEDHRTEQNSEAKHRKNKNHHRSPKRRENELNAILERSRANNNPWVDQVKHGLCEVLRLRKQFVVIFEFDSPRHHGNLQEAILEALLTSAKFSGDHVNEQQYLITELKLAMAWKKLDYAQKYLLTDTTISKWTEAELVNSLVDALRRDYVDFVELLVDFGAPFKNLTLNHIETLFESAEVDIGLPAHKKNDADPPTRSEYYSSYFPHHFDVNRIMVDKAAPLELNAPRELFLWAIFLDRFELAKYLCSKTWNQSVACLLAVRIYRQAAELALHSDQKVHYEKNAELFDTYAMSIIDRCFDHDDDFSIALIKQPAISFDEMKPLELAEHAKCRTFLASKCVQKHVNQQWFGHIDYKGRMIYWRIFLCTLFLPLLPFFTMTLPYVPYSPQYIRKHKKHWTKTAINRNQPKPNPCIVWWETVLFFYQAPIVRFCYNGIFYVLFLSLFSYILLLEFLPLNIYHGEHADRDNFSIPVMEIVLHICIWGLIMEEFYEYLQSKPGEYFSSSWNFIDLTAILLYLVGFITRFIKTETCFITSKIFLCLDLIVWFVATLQLFAAFERLGPKLVMIFNTMKDLSFFLCFILIFLCGFSITSWSLINSASQVNWMYGDDGKLLNVTVTIAGNNSWTWHMLRDITHYGVWKVFGQIDPIDGKDSYSTMAFILAIVFVAIANILLLNVLIALFNVTIQNVQEHSHELWRYQRFLIVNEFKKKPPFSPPFNIIFYIYLLVRYLINRVRNCRKPRRLVTCEMLLGDVKTIENQLRQKFKVTDAMRRESAIANDFWDEIFDRNAGDQVEIALKNIEQKIDHLTPSEQEDNQPIMINQQPKKPTNVESDV